MFWKLWRESYLCTSASTRMDDPDGSANNLNRMRLGPGKHLHGKELFGGAVKGEEFDYFQ
jgi:hypothetical protein